MRLNEALTQGIDLLSKAGIPSPRISAEVLLMHATGCDRTRLYAHPEQLLTDSERVHYGRYLKERIQGKPTQYITGHQEFWGLDFRVNPSVLIPRPETELVVETSLSLVRQHFPEGVGCSIADVGTGSGCIAIALAGELPHARIVALDRSSEALHTARLNAERLGVADRITFLPSDLLEPCLGKNLPPLQMVVSNPPYVAEEDRPALQPEVRDHEPPAALFAGEGGQESYARLILQAARAMSGGGFLVLEVGYDAQERIQALLEPSLWQDVQWRHDLAGIARVVTANCIPLVDRFPAGTGDRQ